MRRILNQIGPNGQLIKGAKRETINTNLRGENTSGFFWENQTLMRNDSMRIARSFIVVNLTSL